MLFSVEYRLFYRAFNKARFFLFVRLVLKWLVCTCLPCGVEKMAAATSTSSRASLEQSMSASMSSCGVSSIGNLLTFYILTSWFCATSVCGGDLLFLGFEEELLAMANSLLRGPKALWHVFCHRKIY